MAGDFIVDYQKQEQNTRRLAQMVQSIASMPEQKKRQVKPTSQFEKMHFWLTSGDFILRSEAIAWAYKFQDTTVLFDESGDPYDFQKSEKLRLGGLPQEQTFQEIEALR